MSNQSTPTVSPTASFNAKAQPKRLQVDSAAKQRAYLDEKRRQRAFMTSTTSSFGEDESESHHDPLHVTAVGLDPHHAQATATSMSRKFFLAPPERLQVDQSVNLMDVESGHYEFETTRDSQVIPTSSQSNHNASSSGGGIFSSLMESFSGLPSTSNNNNNNPRASRSSINPREAFAEEGRMTSVQLLHNRSEASKYSTADLNVTSHSQRKASHRSFIESFLDEEMGSSSEQSGGSGGNGRRKASKKKGASKKVDFPAGYDPNHWEQQVARSQPLLQADSQSVDTVAHANKSKTNKRRGGKKPKKNNRRRRLRPGRLVLVLGALFFVVLIVLVVLIATGQVMWNKWHAPKAAAPEPAPTPLIERNHSYLDVNALPTSTQMLLQQPGSPQHASLQWLKADPKTSVFSTTDSAKQSPLDGLAALQKLVLTTLFFATDGPTSWKAGIKQTWMDLQLNECDWFGRDDERDHSICNRYHQLHAIWLDDQGLKGRLPTEELELLVNLKHVDLSHNHLLGVLPGVWFGAWRNLEEFSVESNVFTGQLPSELGLLTNSNGLRELRFGDNHFSGQLPSELGGLMNHLTVLDVSGNRLEGSIPAELGGAGLGGEQHRVLEHLGLAGNDFVGLIPSELGMLTLLTTLELHNLPQLDHQEMPRDICDLSRLTRLTVDCGIVTCPEGCECTCLDPLPSSAAAAASSSKPETTSSTVAAATVAPQTGTPTPAPITPETRPPTPVPSTTPETDTPTPSPVTSAPTPLPTDQLVASNKAGGAAQQDKSLTAHQHTNTGIHRVKKDAAAAIKQEATNPEPVPAPQPKTSPKPETKTTSSADTELKLLNEKLLAHQHTKPGIHKIAKKATTSSSNPESHQHVKPVIHKVANDMAPSPARGEHTDSGAHSRTSVRKHKHPIITRENGTSGGRRFLRSYRDLL